MKSAAPPGGTESTRRSADRNMFEDVYLNSADFAQVLVAQRAQQLEFLKAIGIVK